uniref:hypothetical protein n=1 Tax=Streptosporangium sp. CA-256172 TaxID=3240076 RepID=UPI003F49871C
MVAVFDVTCHIDDIALGLGEASVEITFTQVMRVEPVVQVAFLGFGVESHRRQPPSVVQRTPCRVDREDRGRNSALTKQDDGTPPESPCGRKLVCDQADHDDGRRWLVAVAEEVDTQLR